MDHDAGYTGHTDAHCERAEVLRSIGSHLRAATSTNKSRPSLSTERMTDGRKEIHDFTSAASIKAIAFSLASWGSPQLEQLCDLSRSLLANGGYHHGGYTGIQANCYQPNPTHIFLHAKFVQSQLDLLPLLQLLFCDKWHVPLLKEHLLVCQGLARIDGLRSANCQHRNLGHPNSSPHLCSSFRGTNCFHFLRSRATIGIIEIPGECALLRSPCSDQRFKSHSRMILQFLGCTMISIQVYRYLSALIHIANIVAT